MAAQSFAKHCGVLVRIALGSQASPRRAAQGVVQFLIVELESDGDTARGGAGRGDALLCATLQGVGAGT